MSIYSGKPFTYYISWSKLDTHYYGVRFANNCDPSDLWTCYFTSSDRVKEFRKIHGEPDVIQIRKIFVDFNEARLWESRVLRKLKVKKRSNWLNDNMGVAFNWKSGKEHQNYGRLFSDEARKKQSISKSKLRWWNDGKNQSFSINPPNENCVRGRLKFNNIGAVVGAKKQKGKVWITNGINEKMIYPYESIPEGYYKGRNGEKWKGKNTHASGTFWWTNGSKTKMSTVSPGPGWRRGRL